MPDRISVCPSTGLITRLHYVMEGPGYWQCPNDDNDLPHYACDGAGNS